VYVNYCLFEEDLKGIELKVRKIRSQDYKSRDDIEIIET
jgi:hypothetical protein